jgi:2',3'-cyclic-nucleotide 2'-phosphodiesterase (5'-nucleotidase family)
LVDCDGLLVGIIGITDYYPQYDDLGLAERGRVTAVRQEATALRRDGAEVVVLLSHAGLNNDRGISWSMRGLVDVIVGGHTHHLLREGDRREGLPIAQAGWNGEHLGRIVIEVDEDGARVVDLAVEDVAEDAAADPAVLAELAACERDLEAWLAEPVGRLEEAAPFAEPENPAALLLLEALLDRAPADIGVLMSLHVQEGLPAGPVTRGHVWEATSSPGNLATATLTGAEVRQMLTRGRSEEFRAHTSRVSRGRAFGALQVIGADLDGDVVLVAGEPLDDDRTYRVTGSDLEFSIYGLLVDARPDSFETRLPEILPELLESYLRSR